MHKKPQKRSPNMTEKNQTTLRTLANAKKNTVIFLTVTMTAAAIGTIPMDIYTLINGSNAKEIITDIAKLNATSFTILTGSIILTTGAAIGAIYAKHYAVQAINIAQASEFRNAINAHVSNTKHTATNKFNALKNKIANWRIRNNIKTK